MKLLTEQYAEQISGVLSCYDRIIIQGILPGFCYAGGMTSFLNANNIRIFDYPCFAEPLRNELRDNAEQIAKENGLEIEFIRKKKFRKEGPYKGYLGKARQSPWPRSYLFSNGALCILQTMA